MRRVPRFYAMATLAALFVCALIAAGCGDDETTTTSSVGENAQQTVDEAVTSCTDEAQQLGGAAGTALEGACTSVGDRGESGHQRGRRERRAGALRRREDLQELGEPAPIRPGAGRAHSALRRNLGCRVDARPRLARAGRCKSDSDSSSKESGTRLHSSRAQLSLSRPDGALDGCADGLVRPRPRPRPSARCISPRPKPAGRRGCRVR